MHEVEPGPLKNQRRRSERVSQPFPLIVRGVDLLGQPFEERTTVLACNFHGCRYASKHHLPQNAWITLDVERNGQWQNVRARVAWTQRPQSIRDFFQVGVELETPANLWALEPAPADWKPESSQGSADDTQGAGEPEAIGDRFSYTRSEGDIVADIPFDSPLNAAFASASNQPAGAAADEQREPNALLRNLQEELRKQAKEAVEAAAARVTDDIRASIEEAHQQRLASSEEFFQAWRQEFGRAQHSEGTPSVELTESQEEFLQTLKLKFEERFSEARDLLQELDQKAQTIRSETGATGREAPRAEQTRLRAEGPNMPAGDLVELEAAANWKERLELEMSLAQGQWNELLQSSLDGGVRRLAAQLSEHSKEVLRDAEQRLAERFETLRQPLAETAAEARQVLGSIRNELEEEMARARNSLSDIEHVAGRIKEYSTRLEASSHDTLNELHRRLENILESQTGQLNRHAEQLLNELSNRLNPEMEALSRQLVDRSISEVETRLAPRLERVPELIRELSGREIEAEEGLRLHRERLRHAGEHNQRELAAQVASAGAEFRRDAEQAGQEALARWNEELRESGIRASQEAMEAFGKSSEWFQQETRARLQVLVEQSVGVAGTQLDELAAQSAIKHVEGLERQSANGVAEARKLIEEEASEASSRSRSQLDEAAREAAASFGEVLRTISGQEAQQFAATAQSVIQERAKDFDVYAQKALGDFGASAAASLDTFRSRMASEVGASVSQGREGLARELSTLLDRFAAERDNREREWGERLERLSQEAVSRHQERLETAGDAWIMSSVRRLNEHGQSAMESLMRFTDQALRDSCAKAFENLAEMMRARSTSSAGAAAFVPVQGREAAENSPAQ